MTLPAGSIPEDNGHKEADGAEPGAKGASGQALESVSGAAEVDPALAPFFSAKAEERVESPAPRSLYTRVLDYSAHAAMIAGLLGFAWTVSDHVAKPAGSTPAKAAAPTAIVDTTAELRQNNQKMASEIGALRASVETLRSALHQDKLAEQVRQLATNLDGVKSGLAATKSETGATLAQLSGKIDHLPHVDSTKLQQVADRLERMERQETDKTVTGSIVPAVAAAKPTTAPSLKPQVKAPDIAADAAKKGPSAAETDAAKKTVIAEWVVRDVYDGVAVVESKHGPMEVVPGVTIPGAGTVRSIDRHGAGWTVTTSKGLIAYMPLLRAREQHGYYRTMPEDF